MTLAALMERSVLLWSGGATRMMTVETCQMNLAVNQVSIASTAGVSTPPGGGGALPHIGYIL